MVYEDFQMYSTATPAERHYSCCLSLLETECVKMCTKSSDMEPFTYFTSPTLLAETLGMHVVSRLLFYHGSLTDSCWRHFVEWLTAVFRRFSHSKLKTASIQMAATRSAALACLRHSRFRASLFSAADLLSVRARNRSIYTEEGRSGRIMETARRAVQASSKSSSLSDGQ
jgi:hypothetical protein